MAIPPEAITGVFIVCRNCFKRIVSGPWSVPSLDISVTIKALGLTFSIRWAKSIRENSETSSQPLTAIRPALWSRPIAIHPGYSLHSSSTSLGESTTFVPRITLSRPIASTWVALSFVLIPPPNWSGIFTAWRMRLRESRFLGAPSRAPSRSTTCKYWAPWACHVRAACTGSS